MARRLLVHGLHRVGVAGIVGRGFETAGGAAGAAGRGVQHAVAPDARPPCVGGHLPLRRGLPAYRLCAVQLVALLAHPMGRSEAFIGQVLWIPPLGWEMGYLVWGWLTDRGLRKGGSRRESLRRMLTWCAVLSLVFALTPLVPGTVSVLVLMFLAMFAASGFLVLSVAYANSVYTADHAGLIAGVGAGSWSAAVAVMMPILGRL